MFITRHVDINNLIILRLKFRARDAYCEGSKMLYLDMTKAQSGSRY